MDMAMDGEIEQGKCIDGIKRHVDGRREHWCSCYDKTQDQGENSVFSGYTDVKHCNNLKCLQRLGSQEPFSNLTAILDSRSMQSGYSKIGMQVNRNVQL